MIDPNRARAFVADIEVVCRRHGLSISHEDSQGGFIIEEFSESNIAWLEAAIADEEADAAILRDMLDCRRYTEFTGTRIRSCPRCSYPMVVTFEEGKQILMRHEDSESDCRWPMQDTY